MVYRKCLLIFAMQYTVYYIVYLYTNFVPAKFIVLHLNNCCMFYAGLIYFPELSYMCFIY